MQIVKDKALRLRVRYPQQILEVIPKSKLIDDNEVLVNWGVEEAQVLRNIGIKNVPAPISGQYGWTGMHKPFEHQKTTAEFLSTHRKAFCFNEQGTGKTASAIWAADFLLTKGVINRVLVVCPLSIMDSAWRNDLFNFAMHRSVTVAYGTPAKRKKLIADNADFVVINYDGIDIVHKEIAEGGFDLIIVDEATHYKNPQTKRWKVLNSLVQPDTWLWMLTGTPAAQSPVDAYGLAKLVNPNAVPKFFSAFRDQVMLKVSQFRWVPKENSTEIVHRALQPAIRFTKEDCLDLPDMVYVKRDVSLTKQQEKYYNQLKKDMMMQAAGESIVAANAAVNMNKLLQVSCGAIYSDTGEVLNFDIKNRYNVLREVIDEASQKTIVFVPFKHAINLLHEKLEADGVTTDIIRGDVPAGKRSAIFERFQKEKDPQVLLIQPQAAAHGVTLTAANTIVWWGPTPSLETYLQANARIHRSGQKHRCTVVQLQGAYVEKHIYSMLDSKIDVHSKVIDLYKEILA